MDPLRLKELRMKDMRRICLDARHGAYGDGPVPKWQLSMTCQETMLSTTEVLQAIRDGQKLRASGAPCLCPRCGTAGEAINDRERLRQAYSTARHAQLTAQGVEPMERERIINAEIDSGAALQAQPVTITRSTT